MSLAPLHDWFVAKHDSLLTAAIIAAIVLGGLLLLRLIGERACASDPEHYTWRSIIGRASSCAYVMVMGFRTRPWMRSCQVVGSTCGTDSAVSMR